MATQYVLRGLRRGGAWRASEGRMEKRTGKDEVGEREP